MKDTFLLIAAVVILYLLSKNKKATDTLRAAAQSAGNLVTTNPPVSNGSPTIPVSTSTSQAPIVVNSGSMTDPDLLTGQNDFNLSGSIVLPA